jgi:hypothetical protein
MTEQTQQAPACRAQGEQMTCSPEELRTLFLFEKLTHEQLAWLCSHGHVELIPPGPVYAEGDPATCFYVLIEGTVVMYRRVGGDDIETNRTSDRGAYIGAFNAYIDQLPHVYNNSVRVPEPSRFFVLDAGDFAKLMHEWFPMAVHLPEEQPQQPGRCRGAGHGGAAGAGRRDAAQARHARGRQVHPGNHANPGPGAGARGRAGREGAGADAAGGVRPRGRD